jgi:OFA family oxalate/formate antiporter-like MFS transporter
MFIASMFIKKPGEDENEGEVIKEDKKSKSSNWIKNIISIVKLKKIWLYWLAFYFNISAGLAIISNEVNFYKYSDTTIIGVGWAISICAIFNSLGRLGVSWISDYLNNRGILFGIIMVTSAILCILGYSLQAFVVVTVLLCNAGYGAMFAIMPSALHVRYGMKDVSKIHGFILSAWAFAGLTGNQLAKLVMNLPNSYSPRIILICSMVLYLSGAYFCINLWSNKKTNNTIKSKTKSLS